MGSTFGGLIKIYGTSGISVQLSVDFDTHGKYRRGHNMILTLAEATTIDPQTAFNKVD